MMFQSKIAFFVIPILALLVVSDAQRRDPHERELKMARGQGGNTVEYRREVRPGREVIRDPKYVEYRRERPRTEYIVGEPEYRRPRTEYMVAEPPRVEYIRERPRTQYIIEEPPRQVIVKQPPPTTTTTTRKPTTTTRKPVTTTTRNPGLIAKTASGVKDTFNNAVDTGKHMLDWATGGKNKGFFGKVINTIGDDIGGMAQNAASGVNNMIGGATRGIANLYHRLG